MCGPLDEPFCRGRFHVSFGTSDGWIDSWSRGGDSAVWPLSIISCRSIGMSGFSRFSRVG